MFMYVNSTDLKIVITQCDLTYAVNNYNTVIAYNISRTILNKAH